MGIFSKIFSSITANTKEVVSEKPIINNAFDADIPTLQGDYAKTIFLWAHNKASAVKKNDEYVRYFLYECGIRNPSAYHKELINDGYFEKASTATVLNSLKVSELKELLSSIGQSGTGKKEVLIERVLQNADENLIKTFYPVELYSLSKKGEEFLTQNNDYVLIHKHKDWGIDWKDYDSRRKPGYSFYDIVWGILNERVLKETYNFGRNAYHCMYQLLKEEGKRENAIEMLLRVLYIDLSGTLGMDCYKLYKDGIYTQKELIEYFNAAIMLAPGITNAVSDYKDVYNDNIVECVYEHKLPVLICDKKLFLDIVHSLLEGTYDEEIATEKVKKEYIKFVKSL